MRRAVVKWIAIGVMVLIVVLIAGRWLQVTLQIDSCLDDGGRWDYEKNHCEGAREAK